MKKKIVILSAAVIGSVVFGLTGCSKDDTTSPVVTLNGASVVDVVLNGTYTEESATANDDEDGAIAVTVSGTVDVDRTGDYTLTYQATDEAGNVGSATRVVHVYNQAEIFEGAYANCIDTCLVTPAGPFNATVTASDTVNKLVSINNFGAFGTSVNIYATITSNAANAAINISTSPAQSLGGTALLTNIYQSDTYVISAASTSTSFQVRYQWTDGTDNDVCTSTYNR